MGTPHKFIYPSLLVLNIETETGRCLSYLVLTEYGHSYSRAYPALQFA